MPVLRSLTDGQADLNLGRHDPISADVFIRLASADDKSVPSPAVALQAGLEAGLRPQSSLGRLPVGVVLLVLLAAGGLMWGGIIGGILLYIHR